MEQKQLRDSHGRVIQNVRVSVTDKCNLRCSYCCTDEPIFLPHSEFLTYSELVDVLGICTEYGVTRVRITGGEPFVRKNIMVFFEELLEKIPFLDIRITTNGVLLEQHLEALARIGIKHLNISLDTFVKEKFLKITGKDYFDTVYSAIQASIKQGFFVKINSVAMRGINDDEIHDFVQFAVDNPVSVRFIEYMPIAIDSILDSQVFYSAKDILKTVQERVKLTPQNASIGSGPAKVYAIEGGKGTFGVITPLSNHFCDSCDRLRISASGAIRTCLYEKNEYSIKEVLRSGEGSKDAVRRVLEEAIFKKPLGVELLEAKKYSETLSGTSMRAIGG